MQYFETLSSSELDETLVSNLERKFMLLSVGIALVLLKPYYTTLLFLTLASALLFQAETVRLFKYGAKEMADLFFSVVNESLFQPYKYAIIGGLALTGFLTFTFWLPGTVAGIVLSAMMTPLFNKIGHIIEAGRDKVDNLVNFRFMPSWWGNPFSGFSNWLTSLLESQPFHPEDLTPAPSSAGSEAEEDVFYDCQTSAPPRPSGILHALARALTPHADDFDTLFDEVAEPKSHSGNNAKPQ